MTLACSDVSGLSCGFALGPVDGVPLSNLYDWHADLTAAARRVEEMIAAREAATDAALEAAMWQGAGA